MGDKQHDLQQQSQQLKQLMSQQMLEQHRALQEQLDCSRDAVKQLMADQASGFVLNTLSPRHPPPPPLLSLFPDSQSLFALHHNAF